MKFPQNLDHPGPDDAFITYRYAMNLAAGRGWVFNPHDAPVLGTSTPLYTMLLALGAKIGADVQRMSVLIGTLPSRHGLPAVPPGGMIGTAAGHGRAPGRHAGALLFRRVE